MGNKRPFAGRRILVLGAGPFQIPVIEQAIELGCQVITADYLPRNPGHRLAAESWNVSTVDKESMLEMARQAHIDGVLTYGSDVSTPTVAFVADALGLPGNPPRTAALLQRKDLIRDLQRTLGLPHPPFVAALSADELRRRALEEGVPFPLLVKPADSSGSKGQSTARSANDLGSSFEIARPFSRCGVVVAETILPDDMLEVVAEVLIDDGQLAFGHYGHNYFSAGGHPRVPVGEVVPGFFGDWVVDEVDRQIQALVTAAGVRIGCMNVDIIVSGGAVHLIDVGLRNGGNYLPDAIRLSTGVDLTTAAICAALAEPFSVPSLHVTDSKWVVTYLVNSRTEGRFLGLQIAEEIVAWLVEAKLFCTKGDPVFAYTRGDAAIGLLTLMPPTRRDAEELVVNLPRWCPVTLQ